MLNQSEPNLILTAHATKLNRPEPNWTEPQTCLAGRNHAFSVWLVSGYTHVYIPVVIVAYPEG